MSASWKQAVSCRASQSVNESIIGLVKHEPYDFGLVEHVVEDERLLYLSLGMSDKYMLQA